MDKYAGYDFEKLKEAGADTKGSTFANFKEAGSLNDPLPYSGNYPPGVTHRDVGNPLESGEENLKTIADRFFHEQNGYDRLEEKILENGYEGMTPEIAHDLADSYDLIDFDGQTLTFKLNTKKVPGFSAINHEMVKVAPGIIKVHIGGDI